MTPLQKQIRQLVKFSAILAALLFILVTIITYFNLHEYEFSIRITESILSGITLAMATIPEEFPVILTVFLSIGAWRLAKKHSLVKNLPSVETLGAVSVLCVDKTGTITMNKMKISDVWDKNNSYPELLLTMGMGCKVDTYDPMEKAMIEYCKENDITNEMIFGNELIKEYAFTDELKIMGNVIKKGKEFILVAKGSPESLFKICTLTNEEKRMYENKSREMSEKGLRVIGVAKTNIDMEMGISENLTDYELDLCGIVGLIDPPRDSIKSDIEKCTQAGLQVVMITGDNGITASSIAKQIGMPNSDNIITGDELNKMSDDELREKIKDISIFSRVIPEQKMRIVKAFKENGEVVAMTGDGVNDAPALKYADIGIAMGERGSEVARETAKLSLFLSKNSFISFSKTLNTSLENPHIFIEQTASSSIG
jgi:Ca2+-transporting ATPase